MKAFISYTRRDPNKKSVQMGQRLARFLISHGIEAIFDELSFNHGKFVANEMIDNIYRSDKFIFLASIDALKSKYVCTELSHAQNRAIQLLPESFFHIVCLSNAKTLNYLPDSLKAFLCHTAYDKSELLLFYEILLSLHNFTIGDLIAKMLQYNPDSRWIILERHQKIELLNELGDVHMHITRTILNATTEKQIYNSRMNMWRIGATDFKDLKLKLHDEKGNEIAYEMQEDSFRGKNTLRYKIAFDKLLLPNETYSFTTEYDCKKGFELETGGEYNFPTEDMVYGYYRLDISFPRDSKPEIPTLRIEEKDKEYDTILNSQGCNKFTYSRFNIDPGINFKFLFKLKTIEHRISNGEI
jgi:hypothetical protein